MAHGKSLILREIQPHPRWRGYEPNPARVASRKAAKQKCISVRRQKRIEKRERQAAAHLATWLTKPNNTEPDLLIPSQVKISDG